MTDPTNLESELLGMQPSPLREEVADGIEAGLPMPMVQQSPWPDRFLLAAVASGTMAACVLVTVLVAGMSESKAPANSIAADTFNVHRPDAGATPLAFARSDSAWVELLK